MSGGVDSSVAAALLKKSGFNVIGVFMKLWPSSSKFSEERAKKVANILEIPFQVLDFKKEFKKKVIDYFLKEYKSGRTPNPCVVCNKEIKFGLLLEKASGLGANFVATGHYAKIQKKFVNSYRFVNSLMTAKDEEKDQSYFLWQLEQKQLKHILFPIGNYTKKEVRNFAKKFGLPVLKVSESQEICFIETTLNNFLSKHFKSKPGKIVDTKGKIIGKHQGLQFYTIGQRKGINLPNGPYYVLEKNIKKNLLIVTKNEKDLGKKELVAENINWISGKPKKLPLKIKAKIRYRHKASPAIIYHLKPNICHLKFTKPQRAVTPGQSVVFYLPAEASAKVGKGEEVLGGGIIKK